jgi:glucose-6-phosphate 1-dehydrogenase
VLLEVASCVAKNAQSATGWTRMIIEKPFGYDAHSSALETKGLLAYLNEDQIYRWSFRVSMAIILN